VNELLAVIDRDIALPRLREVADRYGTGGTQALPA